MPAFLRSVVSRLREKPLRENLPYALGRWASIRKAYGLSLGAMETMRMSSGLVASDRRHFPNLEPSSAARALRRDAAVLGLTLPDDVAHSITDFVVKGRFRHWRTRREFELRELDEFRFEDGMPAVLADSIGVDEHPAAAGVARDPAVLETLNRYLGYTPAHVDVRVLASFPVHVSPHTRQAYGQTYQYHYDVHSFNFAYANFYLTPTDRRSGAHCMVLGSHQTKPTRWLLGSANRTDAEITSVYPRDKIITIEGPAGYGFLQDSSCMHKALPPEDAMRLMMHLRYY